MRTQVTLTPDYIVDSINSGLIKYATIEEVADEEVYFGDTLITLIVEDDGIQLVDTHYATFLFVNGALVAVINVNGTMGNMVYNNSAIVAGSSAMIAMDLSSLTYEECPLIGF